MENYLTFTRIKNSYSIRINPEKPFFKILRIEVPSIPEGSPNIPLLVPKFKLKYQLLSANNNFKGQIDYQSQYIINHNTKNPKFEFNEIIVNKSEYESIQFNFDNESENDEEILLVYSQLDKMVELKDPFEDFNNHINQNTNAKILFSAPFGQGKTTFLNHFFDSNKDKYEVFKLYPVNYSVSHNEDIFKFIKAEILFQLLEREVEFDKKKFSYLNTIPNFFLKNSHRLISPFLQLIPKVGKSLFDIYEKLYKLSEEYFEHHDKLQVDDKDKAIKFIEELYEKEGSIFEDNFYTQLIRQLLEQHKISYNRKNVLIIDDIDRMDPDHIFRIFNVFSANFDSDNFIEGFTNKFGFDKVILVCDYTNIKKLFIHRYGNSYSFLGYLSKYYSKAPYFYDNKKAIEFITNGFNVFNGVERQCTHSNVLIIILKDLIESNELTLRELLNLDKYDFLTTLNIQYSKNSKAFPNHSRLIFFQIISFFENIFNVESIIEKFQRCKTYVSNKSDRLYERLTPLGLPSLIDGRIMENKIYKIIFKKESYSFKIQESKDFFLDHYYYEPIELTAETRDANLNFSREDLYDILIIHAEKYKKI